MHASTVAYLSPFNIANEKEIPPNRKNEEKRKKINK